jgi:hypothetical protein
MSAEFVLALAISGPFVSFIGLPTLFSGKSDLISLVKIYSTIALSNIVMVVWLYYELDVACLSNESECLGSGAMFYLLFSWTVLMALVGLSVAALNFRKSKSAKKVIG